MRIVGGRLRGRRLAAPRGTHIRPTGERVREALFDILSHGAPDAPLDGARVVDLFAGTGALGLEALSRGAAHLTAVERDGGALAVLRANLAALAPEGTARVLAADATRLPPAETPCGIAFVDPPYGARLVEPALRTLLDGGWLAAGAVVAVEHGAGEGFVPPAPLTLADRRAWGGTRVAFLRLEGSG